MRHTDLCKILILSEGFSPEPALPDGDRETVYFPHSSPVSKCRRNPTNPSSYSSIHLSVAKVRIIM